MNHRKNLLLLLGLGAALLTGCNKKAASENDPNHIKVGIAVGPELEVAQVAQKVAKEKYGLDVELITFNDYVVPNEALSHGDVDVNAFQHKPYLDEQVKQRGYKLAIVGNTFVYPIAGYSRKIKSLTAPPSRQHRCNPQRPYQWRSFVCCYFKNMAWLN